MEQSVGNSVVVPNQDQVIQASQQSTEAEQVQVGVKLVLEHLVVVIRLASGRLAIANAVF